MKKLILILMLAMSSMTFASLQDINDYEGYDIGTAPDVIIPSEIAGGMVLVGGALTVGGIAAATMLVVPETWIPAVVTTIAIGATAAISGIALGGISGIGDIF